MESSPQSCVKVQPHQKHNVLRCEPNCHAFLSEERSGAVAQRLLMSLLRKKRLAQVHGAKCYSN